MTLSAPEGPVRSRRPPSSVRRQSAPRTGRAPGGASLLLRPLAAYHLMLVSTLLLLAIGLVMVFSASSVRSYADTGSVFSTGLKQATFVLVGLPLMYAASRLPVRIYRAAAYPLLLISLALLVTVLFVGKEVKGATSWIPLPLGFNLQPSELVKPALALWGADLLVRKHKLLGAHRHILVPLLPVTGLVLLLVMLQPDFGTSVAICSVVVALLWVAGTPVRLFGALCALLAAGAGLLAMSSPHRVARLLSFRDPFADAEASGYQAVQGFYALSSGGWFGLGPGASREKWSGGLPEAHTDYVFAILGEEFGLLGTLTVVLLFAALIYSGVQVAQQTADPFVRLVTAAVTAWLACQAILNMGAVVGLLPITGIPLPLMSFGGSAMLSTLASIGMLLSFARGEPGVPTGERPARGVRSVPRAPAAGRPRQVKVPTKVRTSHPARRPPGRR
ncbi:MAG: putative lipid II flippase FtsW [Actinobacteria bacterium]|nr:putative lipid II flippase FtsW [Actinomycetota bacterium]MBW3648288.1 putative lipid II flippase FtsW [Actinomycetota bacterium]